MTNGNKSKRVHMDNLHVNGTERPGWLVVGALLFGAGALAAYTFVGNVQNRFNFWLHPMDYYEASPGSFQLVEALFGQGWGGLIGRGFGNGFPERVPFAYSDFIVSTIGEELGLTAVMAIILCYGLIVERALRIALISRDGFGKLLAVGLGAIVALQVFVVIGGVTKLIPLTGLTTPFLSYGGSSLVANWAIIALLLRISASDWAEGGIDRLAPHAWAVVAAGTCSAYGGIHAMAGNPTGCMGLPDYLGWEWKSRVRPQWGEKIGSRARVLGNVRFTASLSMTLLSQRVR